MICESEGQRKPSAERDPTHIVIPLKVQQRRMPTQYSDDDLLEFVPQLLLLLGGDVCESREISE